MANSSSKASKVSKLSAADKARAKLATSANLLAFGRAVVDATGSKDKLAELLVACGGDSDKARGMAYAAHVAKRQNPTLTGSELTAAHIAKAEALLAKPGASTSKPDRRTAAEEVFYNSAKQFWNYLRNGAAQKAAQRAKGADKRKEEAKTGDATLIKAEAPNAPTQAAPAHKLPADVHAYLLQQVTTLESYAKKNAKACRPAIQQVVASFAQAMRAAIATQEAEDDTADATAAAAE